MKIIPNDYKKLVGKKVYLFSRYREKELIIEDVKTCTRKPACCGRCPTGYLRFAFSEYPNFWWCASVSFFKWKKNEDNSQ